MADIVDIDHKRKERERNWWAYHDKMEAKLLAGNEDLQLLKTMVEICDIYYEALLKIAEGPDEISSAIASDALAAQKEKSA